MFHWICPECGREIPPAVKECPVCDPKAVLALTNPPVTKADKARPVEQAARVPEPPAAVVPPPLPVEFVPPVPEPDPLLALAEQIRSAHVRHASPLVEEPRPEPVAAAPPPPLQSATPGLAELAAVLGTAERPAVVEPVAETPVEFQSVTPARLLTPYPPALAQGTQAVALLAPPVEEQVVTAPAPVAVVRAVEPMPAPAAVALSVEAPVEAPVLQPEPQTVEVEPPVLRAEPELPAPPVETPAPPKFPVEPPVLRAEPELPPPPVETPAPPVEPPVFETESQPLARLAEIEVPQETPVLQAESQQPVEAEPPVLDAEAPPVVPAPEAEPALVAAAQETALSELDKPLPAAPTVEAQGPPVPPPPQPLDELLPPLRKELAGVPEPPYADNPPSGSRLQLAPLQDYASTASTAVRPAPPPTQILMPDSGPRMTLPGPTLPPALVSLQSASVVTVIGDQAHSKRRIPGWLISALLMLGIPIAGGLLLMYFQPLQHSSADATPAAPQVQAPAAGAVAATEASHSLAQFVEVTGFRIVVDFNKKSEIHYLVVNHSAADLSDMTLYVTLRNANAKPGQPPVARFSFRAPGLGPFESKEMSSAIEKLTRSVSLPDWQDLRAEVQIAQ